MATVLPFPQTKRALRHRRTGMNAAGLISLLLLDRDGEPIPHNVQRFNEPAGPSLPAQSPELLLALLLWSALPKKKQESVRSAIRAAAYAGEPDPCAVQLHNLLNGRLA